MKHPHVPPARETQNPLKESSHQNKKRLIKIFGSEDWDWCRFRLRKTFESGKTLPNSICLNKPSTSERRAYNAFFSKAGYQGALRVNTKTLEQELKTAFHTPNLLAALEICDGPLTNRLALEEQEKKNWQKVQDDALTALPHLAEKISKSFEQGIWRRLSAGNLEQAQTWVNALKNLHSTLSKERNIMLTVLAARICGDAHALDRGQALGRLAIKIFCNQQQHDNVLSWRQNWRSLGVIPPETTAPVLCHGIQWPKLGLGDLWNQSTALGEPLRLTFRSLEHAPTPLSKNPVYICENPTIIEAAARRLGTRCHPIICSDGQASSAAIKLIQMLEQAGAQLFYHGDADWPGIAIANNLFQQFHTIKPWRFNAEHLLQAHELLGPKLEGTPIEATWDTAFSKALSKRGRALHEESTLELLLSDLDLEKASTPQPSIR